MKSCACFSKLKLGKEMTELLQTQHHLNPLKKNLMSPFVFRFIINAFIVKYLPQVMELTSEWAQLPPF